jgi:tetratricopeptide (TPR) repeat protein
MPNENQQTDPKKSFCVRRLPWLLGAAMLAFYLITLNRWVTLANILAASKVSGYLWQPDLYNPLQFLATLPFRLLPAAHIPLALNIFSAVCAAVTMGLLARSVALLPQDRTEAQRVRERSDFSFLTTRSAWFPPLLAVVMLGLQFGFWQHATNFTGESLDLMIFAVVIWLLSEYRLDENENRLYLAAFIYGAGMTNDWALIGFLPIFIAAIIWQRKLEFFNLHFISRMAFCGVAGLLFFLLLPTVAKISGHNFGMSFWEMLKPALKMDWLVITSVGQGDIRHNLLLISVTTLLPVLVLSIRWSKNFGDSSHMGTMLASQMFHLIHAVVFGACVWIMFDPPFSPGQLSMGLPALTFYYLAALALGYYCGYFLLVFGKKGVPTRRNPRPEKALPGSLNVLSPVLYWGTYTAAAVVVGVLAYKNLPLLRSLNDDTLWRYAQLTEKNLPSGGGILLSDAEGVTSSQQTRTLLMQAALARSGRSKDFLVVDTQSLNYAAYHRYLHGKNPQKWPSTVAETDVAGVSPLGVLSVLDRLSQSNTICYLNPSFGYYFELFYLEPHGLVYELKKLPKDTLSPPALPTNLIVENQKFWTGFREEIAPRIKSAIVPYDPTVHLNPANWLIMHLHGLGDPNPNALLVANLYSRSLDYWGVELQRAGQLPAAAECFANAQKINPDNVSSAINLEFNQSLQAGTNTTVDLNRVNTDQFGKYRNWNTILNANGPFDEPSFVFANAIILAQGGYLRQAIAPFQRVRQLAPDNLPARLWLAQLYLLNRLPTPAAEALQDPLKEPRRFGLNETNSTELNVLAAASHFQKNETADGIRLMEQEISRHPDDPNLLTTAAQAFFIQGLYTNALRVIERHLTQTPDDPQWLFGKGYANLQISNYSQAITTFTRVMEISTNNPTARFNRAFAYLQSDRLNDARADYAALQSTYTNAFQVAYGLAEVAWRQQQTNETIRNYLIYLANAPTNAAELTLVRNRLKQLQKK